MPSKCCGAFGYPCDNLTDRIQCEKCYRVVCKVMDNLVTSPHPKRQVYRRHNARAG